MHISRKVFIYILLKKFTVSMQQNTTIFWINVSILSNKLSDWFDEIQNTVGKVGCFMPSAHNPVKSSCFHVCFNNPQM